MDALSGGAAVVKALADQLAQARRQFEHFQDASAAQRQEDKSAYEARIARTEQEAASLRTYYQDSREALAAGCAAQREGPPGAYLDRTA